MRVTLEQVSHRFFPGTSREVTALVDVNLDIPPGDFLGVVGCTGSGKSSLLRHLNGQLQPTEGRVLWDGETLPGNSVRRRVALAFQFPEDCLFADTVEEDVAFGPRNLGLGPTEVGQRVRKALEQVGLGEELAKRSPFALSGGQRRRAALAGVLAMGAEVLCLDEPTAGLDWQGRQGILELLARLNREEGVSVVLVTHRMEDAAQYCKRVAVLREGRLTMLGSPSEVFDRTDELRRAGLEVPPVVEVQEMLRSRGLSIPALAVEPLQAARQIAEVVSR